MEKDLQESNLVFTYGTLKEGHSNHRLLQHCQMVGFEANTLYPMSLTNCGFPYMFLGPTRNQVKGEVYRIETVEDLMYLDALEGVDYGHYERQLLPIVINHGYGTIIEMCWAYVTSSERGLQWPSCPIEGDMYEWQR